MAQIVTLGTLPTPAAVEDTACRCVDALRRRRRRADHQRGIGRRDDGANNLRRADRFAHALCARRNGEPPRFFARFTRRYRTPSNAVIHDARGAGPCVVWIVLILAVASAVARLITYTGACAATLRLRSRRFEGSVSPATFVIPLGPVVPVLAIAVSLLILAGATSAQLLGGAAGLAAGAALFFVNGRLRGSR
jgi:amino acid transporter